MSDSNASSFPSDDGSPATSPYWWNQALSTLTGDQIVAVINRFRSTVGVPAPAVPDLQERLRDAVKAVVGLPVTVRSLSISGVTGVYRQLHAVFPFDVFGETELFQRSELARRGRERQLVIGLTDYVYTRCRAYLFGDDFPDELQLIGHGFTDTFHTYTKQWREPDCDLASKVWKVHGFKELLLGQFWKVVLWHILEIRNFHEPTGTPGPTDHRGLMVSGELLELFFQGNYPVGWVDYGPEAGTVLVLVS